MEQIKYGMGQRMMRWGGTLARKDGKGFSEMTSKVKRRPVGRTLQAGKQQWHAWRVWEEASGLWGLGVRKEGR